MKKNAFTLIELLMTVAIVVILAGILVPAVMNGVKKGQAAKAKAEIVTLVNAIKQYENTYNKLPVPNATGYGNKMLKGQLVAEGLIQALQGDDTIKNAADKKINPRKIPFLEKRNTGEGDYLDPWGKAYKIILNTDEEINLTALFDGTDAEEAKKKYDEDAKIYQSVVIWSAGPDGDWDTKDDVHSFESEYEKGKWNVSN